MRLFHGIRCRDRRGITLVWLALFLLPLLLFFAGLAIDIAYMYNIKNQLQVAADAAALAGAALLDDVDDLSQVSARDEAKKFASKNSAAGDPVQLADEGPGTNTLSDQNDITVGHWDSVSRTYTGGAKPVNAIQVRPRRTGSSPGGPVTVFFGQVFRLIGVNWSLMSANASAIGRIELQPFSNFPLCNLTCNEVTPLSTVSPNLTPGRRFYLKWQDGSPNIGWTTFLEGNTSTPIIEDYILGIRSVPPICNECLFTTQGVGNAACAVREKIRRDGADYIVNGITVHGLKVTVPMLFDDPFGCQAKDGCLTDPGVQPTDPFYVINFSEIIVTDAVPQGNSCPHYGDNGPFATGGPGIVLVGTGPGAAGTSTISCLDCNDPKFENLYHVRLVK